ncbi:MAG TPA: bifunctional rhamnulose-1-phosphate aldolase/short-chain dehydrogenase [Bacilli bacterium]
MQNLWSDSKAKHLDDLELVVYVSNLLGSATSLVQGGGGNTSVKRLEKDFLNREVNVLRVKASGHQLSNIKVGGFTGVKLNEVLPLFDRADMSDDEMVRYIAHTLMTPDSPRPSIETLLHGFIPAKWVLHSHSDAILSFANNTRGEELIKEVIGEDILIVPYHRPGFLVAKQVGEVVQSNLQAQGLVLMHHGLVTWSDSCKDAYDKHIELVNRAEAYIQKSLTTKQVFVPKRTIAALDKAERIRIAAEIAPSLRGAVSHDLSMVLSFDDSPEALEFVNCAKVKELSQTGPATPEHVLFTKPWPLLVEVEDPRDKETLKVAIKVGAEQYRERYLNYFSQYNQSALKNHVPAPRIVLIPGIGLWGVGADISEADVPKGIYQHTVSIIKGAEAIGAFQTMPEAEVFSAEYWPMELYKLSMRPKPRELHGKVALVTGAARGIGLAVAVKLLQAGASVVLSDMDRTGLEEATAKLNMDLAYRNRFTTAVVDVTNEASVKAGVTAACLAFGGLDILVSNAGIAPSGAIRTLSLDMWEKSFAVNARGHFLVSREVINVLLNQGKGGSMVFIGTKNTVAPGKDFGAYSCSKAAEAQLCRIIAIEHGSDKIRANLINPDAVLTDLWSPELIANRAKAYGVKVEEFGDFLRQRTLLKESVTAEDVAEAALYMASDRSKVTTGCMISVDAGARESFPR